MNRGRTRVIIQISIGAMVNAADPTDIFMLADAIGKKRQ
jgi:hypothetical protein